MTIEELQAELGEAKEAIDALTDKNKQLIGEKRKLQAKTQDIDVDAYNKTLDEVEALRSTNSKLEKQHKADIEKLSKDLTSKDTYLQKLVVEDGLTKALIEAGVGKEQMGLAIKALKSDAQLKQSENGYEAVIGDKSVNDFVKEWVTDGEGKGLIFKTPDVGSGATGGDGKPAKSDVDISKMSPNELMKLGRSQQQKKE